jgi:hypothetical protein
MIERGHEDDARPLLGVERLQHVEAVELGHLDVEEREVRPITSALGVAVFGTSRPAPATTAMAPITR